MKSTPSTPTERVTRSRKSTPLHDGLPVRDSPSVRNLRTRSLKKEMDVVETKKTPEKEQTQDSTESAPRTPVKTTRRSLVLPPSAEKYPTRRTRSLSTQHTIFEDAETEAAAGAEEDQNSNLVDNKSIDVQDRTVKQKKSLVKDMEGGTDSTSRTKGNQDVLSENEESADSKIPVLRTSKRLHGNKDSSTEDQPFTRITRRTRRSSSTSSEVPEIKSLEKISEIETTEPSEVTAKQRTTKSEETESFELVLTQSIENLLEGTKKSPIFKRLSALGTVQETEENSDAQVNISERKSPRFKKKSLDTSEMVSETEENSDGQARIAEKKSPRLKKKSSDTNKVVSEPKADINSETKNSCDIQAEIAEKKSPKTKKSRDAKETLPEIQTSEIAENQEPTKSEEMESIELASARSVETKENSSESLLAETKKSPRLKKLSVLGTVQETEENSDVQAKIVEKKSPKAKKSPAKTDALPETETVTNTEEKVIDILETVSDSDENRDVRTRIAQKKSPKNKKKSPATAEAVSEKETSLDVLEAASESKENCDVRARIAEKISADTSELVPETKAETHKEETVLESNENCDIHARIAEKKSPQNKKKSPGTIEAIPETEANTETVLDVLEATSETKENYDVRARIAEKKSPKKKKSPHTTETLPETQTVTNTVETVADVLEVVPETKETSDVWPIMDKKKSPQNKKKSEEVPVTKAETQNETVLDKTMELDIQNSSSVGNLQKKIDQKSEKPESVTQDLCKFREIGENEIKSFISVCRQEIEEESNMVLLPKTVSQVDESTPDGKVVSEEKVDLILLLDESNDSIDIPKKAKTQSPHKDNVIDLTFEENSVFDTPQSSPEEAVASKTLQKTDVVSETPKAVKEDVDAAKTLKSTTEVRGDSGGGKAKHNTPKKVEENSKVEDAVSELEIPKSLSKESDKAPICLKEVGGSSDGEDTKRKKRKTPKKTVESCGIEKELTETLGTDVGESLKVELSRPKTPRSTDESSNVEEIKHKKSKLEKKTSESYVVQYSVSELEIPKTVFKESKKTPKSAKIELRNSEGEEAKLKTPKKKVESSVSELETPKLILKKSDNSSTDLKEVGSSDGEDVKRKKRKTPKKKAEESSTVETEQTKTPKLVIDVGKSLKTETPKSTEESSNVDEVKHKKKSKSAKKNVESSEVEEIKVPKEYIGENSEVPVKVSKSVKDTGECFIVETKPAKTPKSAKQTPEESSEVQTIKPTKTPKSAKKNVESSGIEETKTRNSGEWSIVETKPVKTPKSVKDTGEWSIVETKPAKTPKSGKKSTEESSEVQTIKPTKTPKSAKKNIEKVDVDISKSVKDENKISSKVESTDVTDFTPESENEGENSESKSKKHKKKSKSKKDADESSEVAELKLIKIPQLATEDTEERSKVEEMKRKKTPKSAKKALRESSESEQPKLVESPESAEEAEEMSVSAKKKRKRSAKKDGENFETDERETAKMTKLKRKFAESLKAEPKREEAKKSSTDDSRESSDIGDSKYKKACKDSLESREVKIKLAKKKVCDGSELKEHLDSAVVVVNMNQSDLKSSACPEEKKTLEKVKDSSVISKVKSSKSVVTKTSSKEMINTEFLNIPTDTDSAISFVPISKIELNDEETVTNDVPDVPRKKIKKSAEKGYPKELLDLQDDPDVQLRKLLKKLNKKTLNKKCEINDEPDLELKKLTKKLKKKSQTPCEIDDEADPEPKKLTKKLKKKSSTKCDVNDEPDLQLKKLLKKLKKKTLTKCENDGDEPESENLVKLMKQMKKLKKKSLKTSGVEDVGKKRKAKKSSDVDEKKMKLETVTVKPPGVIFTSNIPSSFDRIDIQNLFLEKNIKLLSMRRIHDKTELCIEDAEQMSDAVTLLTSKFFGSSVHIDEYPLPTKTNTTTDDDGFPLCRLYVNQIPSHATESDLLSLFPKATRCDLPKKNLKNNSRFCYLTFPDKATVLEHLALNEKVNFAGHKLGIHPVQKESSLSVYGDMLKEMFLDIADLDELLLVKNLPSDLNQFSLTNLFPSVLDVKVIPYLETKNRSGAAIVVCKTAEQAKMFLEKDIEWKGEKLDVQKTTKKIFDLVMKQVQFDEDELLVYADRLLKLTNLPKGLRVKEVEQLFPSAILIKVIAKRQFAVVAFSTKEEAKQICESAADKLTVRGKTVEVTHYEFSGSDKKAKSKSRKGRVLHVTGFSPAVTVVQLRAIFKNCSVAVTTTDHRRRYAIVKCKTVGKAESYLAKKNLVVRGKILKIRPAHNIVRQMKRELQLADK